MTSPNNKHLSAQTLSELIQSRITLKVLGEVGSPSQISPEVAAVNNPKVLAAVQSAGWAPFHWRAHILWNEQCQHVAKEFYDWFDDVKPNNKLPMMLSACGALVLVTWIPQFRSDAKGRFKSTKNISLLLPRWCKI